MLWWRSRHWHHHRTSLRSAHFRYALRGVLALGVLCCASSCAYTTTSTTTDIQHVDAASPLDNNSTKARVIEVIDGDTVKLRIGKQTEIVRLIGIDTPETVHPTKPVECFGPEASAHLKNILPKDTEVLVQRDVEARDYYHRLLLYLYRASDELFVNQHMVETGHAIPYPFEPNTAYSRTFAAIGNAARTAAVGLWGTCPR